MQSITYALGFLRLETETDALPDLRCPTCHPRLTLLQPDIESPDRLLGVCPACRGWFLIDISSAAMVRLPDRDALRGI